MGEEKTPCSCAINAQETHTKSPTGQNRVELANYNACVIKGFFADYHATYFRQWIVQSLIIIIFL